MTLKPFRADGGDIGAGRIREIADNPYGDEEKCWMAKRVLALLDEIDSLESFRIAFTEFHDKTEWVQGDKRFDVIIPWGKHRADALKEYIDHLEGRLEAAEKRIAELEARKVTLPAQKYCPGEYAGSVLWGETEVWNQAISECAKAIRAAGIGKGE